jgi:hypothetical protein
MCPECDTLLRPGAQAHLVALHLILSPQTALAIESHTLRSAGVLIIQNIDKKSNCLNLNYVGD